MRAKESVGHTLRFALGLCVACSVVVSGVAVLLKEPQAINKMRDRHKKMLSAAGLYDARSSVDPERLMERFSVRLVDLERGEFLQEGDAPASLNVIAYDQREAATDPQLSRPLGKQDIAGLGRRARYAKVYLLPGEQGGWEQIVLPIHGYGLWGTLYGFLVLRGDANTVTGISFYEHKETPGLGGEVENPIWRRQWRGKQIFDAQGNVALRVLKSGARAASEGAAGTAADAASHRIDSLSGATLTSRGVENMITFWLGPLGFGPFLENIRSPKE